MSQPNHSSDSEPKLLRISDFKRSPFPAARRLRRDFFFGRAGGDLAVRRVKSGIVGGFTALGVGLQCAATQSRRKCPVDFPYLRLRHREENLLLIHALHG